MEPSAGLRRSLWSWGWVRRWASSAGSLNRRWRNGRRTFRRAGQRNKGRTEQPPEFRILGEVEFQRHPGHVSRNDMLQPPQVVRRDSHPQRRRGLIEREERVARGNKRQKLKTPRAKLTAPRRRTHREAEPLPGIHKQGAHR